MKSTGAAPANRGPAMGRYAGDRYFSGGAYYFSTLGAAEFYYSLAGAVAAGADLLVTADNEAFLSRLGIGDDILALSPREVLNRRFEALLRRGDQFMATVAAYTPVSGELSEQFDQATGAQTSAKNSRLEPCCLHHRLRRAGRPHCGHETCQSEPVPHDDRQARIPDCARPRAQFQPRRGKPAA